MEDINNYIKENDTDNVILNKLKELGTKLTGQDNVQGETVAEVLDFINNNYSGSGSGSKTVLYINEEEYETGFYAYKDESCTIKLNMNELYDACEKGCIFKNNIYDEKYLPIHWGKMNSEEGVEPYTFVNIKNFPIYSSEYMQETSGGPQ